MNLTEWWLAFATDLDELEPKVSNSQAEAWLAARVMIAEGAQIEANFLWGSYYAAKINVASEQLGAAFYNEVTGKLMHLPSVTSPDSLLFAMTYYQHLLRYQAIDQGNSLVLSQLIKEQPSVHYTAIVLKKRLEEYCLVPEHLQAINTTFPEVTLQRGPDFLAQVAQWLAAEPVVDKLIKQLESATGDLVGQYDAEHENISALFIKIEDLLDDKMTALREISAYKKLIELLNEDTLLPDDFSEAYSLRNNYPDFAEYWLALNEYIPAISKKKALKITGVRTVIGVARFAIGMLSSLTQVLVGPFTPQYVSELATGAANTLDDLTSAITPISVSELRKQLLIQHAEQIIATSAASLSPQQEQQIGANDFNRMSATQVHDLAEKVALLQHMLTLKKCLIIYQLEHTTGFAKFSLSSVLKPITALLSHSFLRPLMFDRVLLVLEAEQLEIQVNELIHTAKATEDLDTKVLKGELLTLLKMMEIRAKDVSKNSKFLFFRQESETALENFKAVVTLTLNNSL